MFQFSSIINNSRIKLFRDCSPPLYVDNYILQCYPMRETGKHIQRRSYGMEKLNVRRKREHARHRAETCTGMSGFDVTCRSLHNLPFTLIPCQPTLQHSLPQYLLSDETLYCICRNQYGGFEQYCNETKVGYVILEK